MRIKRIIAIVISAVMLMALFASCDVLDNLGGSSDNGEGTVNGEVLAALKKTETLRYKMTENSKTQTIEMTGDQNLVDDSDTTTVFYMDGRNFYSKTTAGGVETVTVFVDDTMYMNAGGVKTKYEIPLSKWEEQLKEYLGEDKDMTLADLVNFQGVERVENADGTVTITYTKPSETPKFNVTEYNYTIAGVTSSLKLDKDSAVFTYVIDSEGRIKSTYFCLYITMSIVSEATSYSASATYKSETYTEYDYEDTMVVTVPEDADEYK